MHVDELIASPDSDVLGIALIYDNLSNGRVWLRKDGTWSDWTRQTETSYPDDVRIFTAHTEFLNYLDKCNMLRSHHFKLKGTSLVREREQRN